jgi:hypothetical protein
MRLFSFKACCSAVFGILFCTLYSRDVLSQQYTSSPTAADSFSSSVSSSSFIADDVFEEGSGGQAAPNARRHSLLNAIGVDVHAGVNGIGGDIAMPVAQHFNLRLGGQYFKYSNSFSQDGANITASLHLGDGAVAIDWFPFHNGFRISPQAFFAIQTHVQANVIVPVGQTITLNGEDFTSSATDPLHGTGAVTTRKTAPGISIGWGNISPRGDGRLSFPVEVGFYYIGQPDLKVSFSGTACSTQVSGSGCEDVTQDPNFQSSLKAFITRNQHNVSYASFFPIASVGVGYRF